MKIAWSVLFAILALVLVADYLVWPSFSNGVVDYANIQDHFK